jgi:molybdopterin synthase sulfur carrier subunit
MEVLLFGIAREIVGSETILVPREASIANVADLRSWLCERYPQFKGLSSLAVAVDNEYATDEQALAENAEIALIPPVSGG